MRGYVDIGNGLENNDDSPIAKDALVFMAVSINGSWKIPIAYFFIDGMSGVERSNLVTVAIKKLFDIKIRVIALTCDGSSCHLAMLKNLGADISIENMSPSFVHPMDSSIQAYVLLDICHMLKLVRNALGEGGIFTGGDNNVIQWKYISC